MVTTFNNYKDYIKFLKSFYFKKEYADCNVYNEGSKLVIEINNTDTYEYVYENDSIKTFFKEWLGENDKKHFVASSSNNYQLLANSLIQEVLLIAEDEKFNGNKLFKKFYIKKKNGKKREIIAPSNVIKKALQNVNKIFQSKYDYINEDFQVAYKHGKNVVNNAEVHKENEHIFKIDLTDFFISCKRNYVDEKVDFLFKYAYEGEWLKNKFLDVILNNNALFIGSPVSGTLANAIISAPVRYIKNICEKYQITFSVYADDMTFGSPKYIPAKFIEGIFNVAFTEYHMEKDFKVNLEKCYGLSKSNRFITGVVLNDNNELTPRRAKYNRIKMTLHQLYYGDSSHIVSKAALKKLDPKKYWTWNQFKGNIAYCIMVDESGKMKTLLSKYKDIVKQYKLLSDETLEKLEVK